VKILRRFFYGLIILCFVLLLTGCGVPQEDYDKAMDDLAAAQNSIHGLETKYSEVTDLLETLYDDLSNQKTAYVQLMFEYDSLKSDSEDLMADAETFTEEYVEQDALLKIYEDAVIAASDYMEIVIELYTPAFTGGGLSDQGVIDNVKKFVDKTGDEELLKLFDTWVSNPDEKNLASDILVHCFLKLEELLFS